jgi:hypothetical protein
VVEQGLFESAITLGNAYYVALCGGTVLPGSLLAPEGQPCDLCSEVLSVATRDTG